MATTSLPLSLPLTFFFSRIIYFPSPNLLTLLTSLLNHVYQYHISTMGLKVLTQTTFNQYHVLGITTRLDSSILVIRKTLFHTNTNPTITRVSTTFLVLLI